MPLWLIQDGIAIDTNTGNALLCDTCPCNDFIETGCICCEEAPEFLEFSITGPIGEGNTGGFPSGCTEEECTDGLARTYLLEFNGGPVTPPPSSDQCQWFLTFEATCINTINVTISIGDNDDGDGGYFILTISLNDSGFCEVNQPRTFTYVGPRCFIPANESESGELEVLECPLFASNSFTLRSGTSLGKGCCQYTDLPSTITVSPV